MIHYECEPGYVASGRTVLMCDVDERWNGPPPRCDPIFCPEPASIRHGGFSLDTNSTVVGTIASYYCTTPRHVLVGLPKLNCLKDGTWDGDFPKCRLRDVAPEVTKEKNPNSRFPNLDRDTLLRRPILQENLGGLLEEASSRPTQVIRRKKPFFAISDLGTAEENESNVDPRFPIRNEIPDSANVQANQGPKADVPVSAVQNERESRTQQLNLGKIAQRKVLSKSKFLTFSSIF